MITAFVRAPMVHFAVIGLLIFAFERGCGPELAWRWQPEVLVVSVRPEAASYHSVVDEAILAQEAVRLQLHDDDPVIRRRLLQNMRFAFGAETDTAASTPEAERQWLRQATALGMLQHDLVARRRLAQLAEQYFSAQVRVPEAEVRAHVQAHPERYATPAKLHLKQHFFASGKGAIPVAARAQAALAALISRLPPPDAGDPLPYAAELVQTNTQLQMRYGLPFAAAVQVLPAQQWSAPIASPYGLHLVWVLQRLPPQAADWAEVHQRAQFALQAEAEHAAVRQQLQTLRRHYQIVTAEAAP